MIRQTAETNGSHRSGRNPRRPHQNQVEEAQRRWRMPSDRLRGREDGYRHGALGSGRRGRRRCRVLHCQRIDPQEEVQIPGQSRQQGRRIGTTGN